MKIIYYIVLVLIVGGCSDNIEESYTYNVNGNLESVTSIKNGVPDGKYVFYYDNGFIENTGTYVQGKKEGTSLSYYPSGKLQQEAEFKDGELYYQRNFREDGSLKEEDFFEENMFIDFILNFFCCIKIIC